MKKHLIVVSFFTLLIVNSYNIYAQWVQLTGGEITSLASKDSIIFAGTWGGGVMRSTDNGETWEYANNGLATNAIYSWGILDSIIFIGTGQGLFVSSNFGLYWYYKGFSGKKIHPISVNNSKIYLSYYSSSIPYLYCSYDKGDSWQLLNNQALGGLSSSSFAFKNDNIYAGFYNGGMFLSTDNGNSWVCYSSGLPTGGQITCLEFVGSTLFGGTGFYGMYKTTNDGLNWESISSGIIDLEITCINKFNSSLFIGTYGGGVYYSSDQGSNWIAINSGLSNLYLGDIVNNGTYLFIGTKGDGVWRRPLSEVITEVNDPSPIIERFVLEQNYPNPFNPNTKISWQTPLGSWQTLKVYDVLGNEVATLVNEYRSAGSYEVEFKSTVGSNQLANGVYFYRLQAGDYIESKKMILLK